MTDTDSWLHRCERTFLGILGSSIVCAPAVASWYESNVQLVQEVASAQVGFGVSLAVVWVLSVYMTAREPERHIWGCVFKSAGLPGLLIAAGHGLQVGVN